ncbi:MAG: TonB family protein [Deltaproteobacteria bacterium]|nr:TonB family protein [Deltaproteobacteria bacterium]
MGVPIFLEVFREDELLEKISLDKKVIKIGRLASAHVRIDDDDVSRVHAVIEVSGPGEIFIIDMGSAKGTSVNGKKVTTKSRISEGDEIVLGKIRILVHTDPEKIGVLETAGDEPEVDKGGQEEDLKEDSGKSAEDKVIGNEEESDSVSKESPPRDAKETVMQETAKSETEPPAEAQKVREISGTGEPVEQEEESGRDSEPEDLPEQEALDEDDYPEDEEDLHDYEEGYHEDYEEYEGYDPDLSLTEEDLEEIEDHRAGEVLQVKMFWEDTMLGVEHLNPKKNQVITVGEDKKAHFYVPTDSEMDLWPLVKVETGEYLLCIAEGMEGYVERGGERTSVKTLVEERKARPSDEGDGIYEYPFPGDATAHVAYDTVEFDIKFVVPGKKVVVPWWTTINWALFQTFILTAALEIAVLGLAFWYPPEAESLSLDLFSTPNRFVKFIIQAPKEKKKKNLKLGKKPGNKGNAGRYKGKEGRAGNKNKPIKKKKLSSEDIKKWLDATKRARDAKVAKSKGILKILGNAGGSSGLSSVFGRSGLGGDIDRALGGVTGGAGTGNSDLGGYGGLGERGTGPGGGGTGDLIGLGRLGTAGRGGDGNGYGYGMGQLGRKGERGVSVETGQAIIMGALDRSIIKRVIRSHRAQIKYCYDRELVRTKGLFGKIVVQFTIQPSGRVSQASVAQTTMHNRNVENCVVTRIKTWRFPKPKGGGIVIVKYPFIFKTAGN